jgi:hypothetical protein
VCTDVCVAGGGLGASRRHLHRLAPIDAHISALFALAAKTMTVDRGYAATDNLDFSAAHQYFQSDATMLRRTSWARSAARQRICFQSLHAFTFSIRILMDDGRFSDREGQVRISDAAHALLLAAVVIRGEKTIRTRRRPNYFGCLIVFLNELKVRYSAEQ